MTINFQYMPAPSLRLPGVFFEVNASRANTGAESQRGLIIGQIASFGTMPTGAPLLCQGVSATQQQAGHGSMLALMVEQWRKIDPLGELWMLPLADDGAAASAISAFTLTGTSTGPGTLVTYIGGYRVLQYVAAGTSSLNYATALIATINAANYLPFTAVMGSLTSSSSTVLLGAINLGAAGNELTVCHNFFGAAGGEMFPPGVTSSLGTTPTAFYNGATNPSLTAPLLALQNKAFDFVVCPYTDTASLTAMDGLFADATGRWSWSSEAFGAYFNAYRGTVGAVTTFGASRNGDHACTMGFNASPTPAWLWATAVAAATSVSVRADPALTLAPIALPGIIAPPIANRFIDTDRETLLHTGISTFKVAADGTVQTERLVTNWQTNAAGAPDNSWLDVETNYTLMASIRDLRTFLLTNYGRKKLVLDETRISDGTNTTTASLIKAAIIARYRYQEQLGWVQNSANFAANILVENAGNGQVRVMAPIDCANQLRIIAVLVNFLKS